MHPAKLIFGGISNYSNNQRISNYSNNQITEKEPKSEARVSKFDWHDLH